MASNCTAAITPPPWLCSSCITNTNYGRFARLEEGRKESEKILMMVERMSGREASHVVKDSEWSSVGQTRDGWIGRQIEKEGELLLV